NASITRKPRRVGRASSSRQLFVPRSRAPYTAPVSALYRIPARAELTRASSPRGKCPLNGLDRPFASADVARLPPIPDDRSEALSRSSSDKPATLDPRAWIRDGSRTGDTGNPLVRLLLA